MVNSMKIIQMKKFLLTAAAILFAIVSVNAQFTNAAKKSNSAAGAGFTYRGEVNIGMSIGGSKYDGNKVKGTMIGPYVTGTYGIKFNDYLFAGVGAGLKYMHQGKDEDGAKLTINNFMLPLFLEVKGFYPISDEIAPFLVLDLGYSIHLGGKYKMEYNGWTSSEQNTKGGFMFKIGAGLAYKQFTFGIGYDRQNMGIKDWDKNLNCNSFYFTVGYVFKE